MLKYLSLFLVCLTSLLKYSVANSQELNVHIKLIQEVYSGRYPSGANLFISEYLDQRYENELDHALALSDFLIFAAESKDWKSLDWIYKLIDEEAERLWSKGEGFQYISFRLTLLNDIAKMQDPAMRLSDRAGIIDAHDGIFYLKFLKEHELLFACNKQIDLLIELNRLAEANNTVFKCVGQIANFENINPTEAYSFLARVEKVRDLSGVKSGTDQISKTFENLLNSNLIAVQSPMFLNSAAILASVSANEGSEYALAIYDYLAKKLDDNIFVPEDALRTAQYAYDYLDALYGLSSQKKLGDFIFQSNFAQITNLREFTSGDRKPSEVLVSVENSETTPSMKFLASIVEKSLERNKQLSTVQNLRNLNNEINNTYINQLSYTTFERSDTGYDRLIENVLIRAFSNQRSGVAIDDEISRELFKVFFKAKHESDFFSASAGDTHLKTTNLDYLARSYIKLAKDLQAQVVSLCEHIAKSAIEFAEQDFRQRDLKESTEGPGNELLYKYRTFAIMVEQFQLVSAGAFKNLMTSNQVSIDRVQSALSDGEVVVAYKRFVNFGFKCFIERTNIECFANDNQGEVEKAIKRLRNSIIELESNLFENDDAKFLYKEIFGDLKLDLYSKVYIFPPREDLSLPFNVLVSDNGFVGLNHDILLLSSLIPQHLSKRNTSLKKGYIGVGNPNYSNTVLASNDFLANFNLRSANRVRAIENLVALPETADEIIQVSERIPKVSKKVLLGELATEIQFRKTDFSKYKFYHFATHGLVSGELDDGNEPALVLSVPAQITSSFNDALLTETEILEFDFSDAVIFLSACQTVTDFGVISNSGYNGLANAFLTAGATEVVATQWSVETTSAKEIIADAVTFAINDTLDNGSPLRSAQIKYAKNKDKRPFFWAPYIRFASLYVRENLGAIDVTSERVSEIPYTEEYGYEAGEFFVYKDQLYLSGSQIQFNTKNPATGFIKNINTGKLVFFDTPMYRVFNMKHDKIVVSTIERADGMIFPALAELNPDKSALKRKVFIQPKLLNDLLETAFISRSRHNPDGSIDLLLQGTLHPENIIDDEARALNTRLLEATYLVQIDQNLKIVGIDELPRGEEGKIEYRFAGAEIYGMQSRYVPKPLSYNSKFGIQNCYSPNNLDIFKLGENLQSLNRVYEYEDGTFYEFVDQNTIVLMEYCGGPSFVRFLYLDSLQLTERLPVSIGVYHDVRSYPFANKGQLFLGTMSLPATFRLNRIGTRSASVFQQSDFILDPSEQYLRFLVYGDLETGFTNVDLRFFRQLSYTSDIIEYKGSLYVAGKENEAVAFIEKYDLKDIKNFLNIK